MFRETDMITCYHSIAQKLETKTILAKLVKKSRDTMTIVMIPVSQRERTLDACRYLQMSNGASQKEEEKETQGRMIIRAFQ